MIQIYNYDKNMKVIVWEYFWDTRRINLYIINAVSICLKDICEIVSLLEILNYGEKRSGRWSCVIYIYDNTNIALHNIDIL